MTHYNPFPSDAEIDAIVMANAEEQRKQLIAEREAAIQAAFEALEEQMTDANKATETEQDRFTITVAGAQASGKTTLLLFLLDALADAGMLSGPATKALTADPADFLYNNLTTNEKHYETVDLDLDLTDLFAKQQSNQPAESVDPRLIGNLTYDSLIVGLVHPETIKMWLVNHVTEMVDRCFEDYGRMMPITLEVDPY